MAERRRGSLRSLLGGVGGKVLALAIVPSLFVSALSMVNVNHTSGLFEATLEARERKDRHDQTIFAASDTIKSELATILNAVAVMMQAHHKSMMARDQQSVAETLEARAAIGSSMVSIQQGVKLLRGALLNLELDDLEVASAIHSRAGTTRAAIGVENQKRLISVIRLSNSLPNLFGIYIEANDRTIAFVKEEDFAAAAANFVFEEEERLRAMNRALAEISVNLGLLSKSARDLARVNHETTTGETFAALEVISTRTYALLAAFTIVLILVAIWFALRGLVNPLRGIASAMSALGTGETDVAIPVPGNDEIGDMARTLGFFKDTMVGAVRAKSGLDCVSVGVTITNIHGAFIYANRSALDLFNDLETQLHGTSSHIELPNLVGADSGQVLHHIGMEHLDLTSLTPGTPRQLNVANRTLTVVADPVVDRFGKPLGSVVGWDDITERRKAEEEIRQLNQDLEQRVRERTNSLTELNRALESEVSERARTNAALEDAKTRLGAIMANLADGLITIDEDGIIGSVNPTAGKLFGYAEGDLLGRNVRMLMPEPDSARHDEYIKTYRRTGTGKIIGSGGREVVGMRCDGSVFPMDLAISEMRVADRSRYIGLVRDVTDRKNTELNLQARAYQQGAVVELGRHALEGSDILALFQQAAALVALTLDIECSAIYEIDPGGEQLLLCAGIGWKPGVVGQVKVNADAGTSAGLALTSEGPIVIDDLVLEKRLKDFELLASHGVVSTASVAIKGRDRDVGVLETHSTRFRPFTEADVAFLQAMSNTLGAAIERKFAEEKHERLTEQFHQSQKTEAIGQLAGGVAHDFNNILMIIDGYTRLARNGSGLSDEAKAPLDQVLNAADKAAGLTKQLLAFGRRQHLETKVTSVSKVMSELEALLGPLLGETIDLRISVPEDGVFVETDVSQLTQALINLAINARDAMPRGGRVAISAGRVEADDGLLARHTNLSAGSYLRVDVTDEGEGMDEETLASIFDPFFTTKEQGKGTGLGLAMVYGFVDQCEGAIEVESEPGQGATFSIYLPTTEKPVAVELNGAEYNLSANGETILLAEDDQALRDLVQLTLEELGYTVIVAGDGFEALEVELEHDESIDLLLSDVVMPNLGGIELARELLETRPDMKVLLMSGYPSRGEIKRIDLPEDIPLLHKPCPPERLARAVREVLEGRGIA